jgi:Na+/proline symporter/signal transduction histidine kinase
MNIDVAIFIGFLAINLVVGLRYGRGVKTIGDYALGGRNFSTTALVSTIVATLLTGSGFFVLLSKTYSDGLSIVIASSSQAISIIITALFFIPRMGEFMGSLSIAEVMGNLYGKQARFITAVCGILWIVGSIAVQFKVFGNLFNYFLGVQQELAIIIAATVIILYSAFGGIRAVTYTDILQFFTFGVVIPLIGILIWNDSQSAHLTLNTILENPKFDIYTLFSLSNPNLISFIFLIFYFSVPTIGPIEFQRISMGRNMQQVKTAFLIAAALFVFIKLLIAWIPILISTLKPGLEPSQIISYIINNYTYTGLKGLLIIGVSAMAMSSADSFINSSSVLFGHDLKEVFDLKVDNLLLSKLFALLLGTLAIYLALSTNDLLSMIMTAASFYMPIVTIPLILSIMGFRSSTKSVLIAMGAGFATVVIWPLLKIELEVIIPAMLVNLLCLFGSHYILKQPGGWVGSKDTTYLNEIKSENKRKRANVIALFTMSNFIEFCKKTAPKNELMYMGLGIYCIFYTFSTMYSTQVELLKENGRIILTIYQIMMVTGVVMAMYPIWPPRIKHEIIVQVAWNIVIFYMLIFFSSFFVMVSNLGQLQFAVFTLNMVIAAILTGWKVCISMVLVGFYLSSQFYKYYAGIDNIDASIGSPQFIFMYMLMLAGTALIIFLKPKQEYLEATEEKVGSLESEVSHLGHEVTDLSEQVTHYSQRAADQEKEIDRLGATAQKILNNVNHELRLPIGNVVNFSEMLHESLGKSDNKLVKELSKEVYDNSNRVSTMILNMLDLATLDVKKVNLQKTTINFSELVTDRVKRCRKIYLRDKKIDFELTITPEIMIAVDPNYIRQTIDNLVINSINFSTEGLIKVSVSRKDRQVIFTITDQGKGIPENELSDIFNPFKMGSNSESKACGRGVGLALCKSAVEAHGGSISADSNGETGATLRFVLPL